LDNDGVAVSVLFVADAFGKPESVDITAEHEGLP